jgi:uncharacterized protein (DUF58 family)
MATGSNVTIRADARWAIALACGLAAIQLVFPSPVWIVLLWLVGGLAGLGYYWTRQMARHVSIGRELRFGWFQVGDRLEERFTLANHSWLPVLWAEIADESDLPGYEVRRVASCEGHSVVRWTVDAECTRRGIFTLGPWSLRMGDPFGFFTTTFRYGETQPVAIYPPVVHLPEIALPRGLSTGPAPVRKRIAEAMGDVSHTRPYQPGDPLRLIHWPSTAHRGDLIVKEPDTEISGDLWIVLDLDQGVQAGRDQESTEEYGVILAASLADRTLRQNRAVGLVAHGTGLTFIPPGRGQGHMWHLLRSLARVKAGVTQRLAGVLSHMRENMGPGTTMMVITPSCQPDWVDALLPLTRWGIAPAVVLLDAGSFEQPPLPRGHDALRGMREWLAKAGIATYVIRQGFPLRYTVPPRRRGHWEFKTTPLGRAIVVRRPEEA